MVNSQSATRLALATEPSPRELKLAEALAKEIDSQLVLEKFDWAFYLKGQQKPPGTVAE